MYKYLLLFFFFLNVALCQGQNRFSKSIHFSYYIDSTAELTSAQVIHQDFFEVGPISLLLDKLDHKHVNWIKINAPKEKLEHGCEIKIKGSFYDKVYEITGQNLKEIKRANKKANSPYIFSLSSFTDKQFLLKRKSIKSILKKSTGIEIKRTRNKQGKMFEDGFIFITIFLSFFILIQFIFNRDKDFLLYFLYLFLTSCIYAHSSYFQEVNLTKAISNRATTGLSHFLTPLAMASYLIFVSSFLNIPKKLPKVSKVFKFIFICIGIAMLGLLFIHEIKNKVYFLTTLSFLIFPALMYSFYHIFKLWYNKDWGTNLIIAGSFVLFLATLISGIPYFSKLFSSINPNNYFLNILKEDSSTHLNMFILKGAMLIEMLLYASALGIKRVNLERDKGQAEKQLLKKEIDTQKKEIALQQKIAEAEHKALKAQMNPHFMFKK